MFKGHNVLILTLSIFYLGLFNAVMESLPLQVKLEPQLPGYFLDYEFDTKTGYPLVIIEKEMRIFPRRFDFEDWLSLQSAETFDKSQLCEAVY
jgi:hypothetical protein